MEKYIQKLPVCPEVLKSGHRHFLKVDDDRFAQGYQIIASIFGYEYERDTAYLFAAAAELLEACNLLVEFEETQNPDTYIEALMAARQAIAAAHKYEIKETACAEKPL